MVGILILIYQNITEFLLIICSYIRKVLQKFYGAEYDIIKIQCIGSTHTFLIFCVEPCNSFFVVVISCLISIVFRIQKIIFCTRYLTDNTTRIKLLFIKTTITNHADQKFLLIIFIVNRKVFGIAQLFNVTTQDSSTCSMKCMRPNIFSCITTSYFQTLAQLPCGFIGKGNCNDFPGFGCIYATEFQKLFFRNRTGLANSFRQSSQMLFTCPIRCFFAFPSGTKAQQINDAVDQHRGLSTASTSQQQ